MGPVQVLVVGFDEPSFTGEVLAEFDRLGEAGIVRLIDVVVVERHHDGTIHTVELPADLGAPGSGLLATDLLGGGNGSAPDPAGWSLDPALDALRERLDSMLAS
jgi:hypothetical protein